MKKYMAFLCLLPTMAMGNLLSDADSQLDIVQTACSGLSDEIASVAGIARVNTAVTTVGTVAGGGALYAGVQKNTQDKRIDEIMTEICQAGGCDVNSVATMSEQDFFNNILLPMQQLAEIQERTQKSKKLGNWRTGLMAVNSATGVASAVLSGINRDQSDLIQHATACNIAVSQLSNSYHQMQTSGINPITNPIMNKISSIITWCTELKVSDLEKIERRMTAVMGTGIGGAVIGATGTGVSAAANTDKIRTDDSDDGLRREKRMNTAANVMAGLGTAVGAAGTGVNISVITLANKMVKQATLCEEVLQ